MTKLTSLTTNQLRQVLAIKEQIETLQSQIQSIAGGETPTPAAEEPSTPGKRKYHMSAAHRRKLIKALARARKIRWAKGKAKGKAKSKPAKKDRRSSPATRAKLAAAARARWAKVKEEGRKTL